MEEKRQADISQEIFYVDQEFATEHIKPSYSGHTIAEKGSKVTKPFTHGNKRYICIGSSSGGADMLAEWRCYQLVPKEEFKGETRTYTLPEGRDYEGYYESLRNDPNGFYHGMLVAWGKNDCVLAGPEVTFMVGEDQDISQEIIRAEESSEAILTGEELDAYEQAMDEDMAARDEERARLDQVRQLGPEYPCHGCLNVKLCDRGSVVAAEDGRLVCDQRQTKETRAELEERATVEVPTELRALIEEKAGTRAQVLDVNEIWLGQWRSELQQGYALLGNELERIDDPAECLERCTEGFHYGYDSRYTDGRVYYVCTNPKCLSKKKAAFTRAKNAQGQAKKKSELAAIRKAVQQTTVLDRPRMKLIILAQMEGSHTGYYGGQPPIAWLWQRLGLPEHEGRDSKKVIGALDKLTDEEVTRLVVELMLEMLTYRGDVESYRIRTTMPLNWMGISVNGQSEEKDGEEDEIEG